jgi:hypothetical protein
VPQPPSSPPAGGHPSGGGTGLSKKWGPLPIWVYAVAVIGLLWAYEKYRSNQSAASSSTSSTSGSAEPSTGTGYTVIENNIPPTSGATSGGKVRTSPPGTSTSPPTTIQGGQPPQSSAAPEPASGSSNAVPSLNTVSYVIYKALPTDTWASIAKKYYLTPATLEAANTAATRGALGTISTTGKITGGEQILIPFANT